MNNHSNKIQYNTNKYSLSESVFIIYPTSFSCFQIFFFQFQVFFLVCNHPSVDIIGRKMQTSISNKCCTSLIYLPLDLSLSTSHYFYLLHFFLSHWNRISLCIVLCNDNKGILSPCSHLHLYKTKLFFLNRLVYVSGYSLQQLPFLKCTTLLSILPCV